MLRKIVENGQNFHYIKLKMGPNFFVQPLKIYMKPALKSADHSGKDGIGGFSGAFFDQNHLISAGCGVRSGHFATFLHKKCGFIFVSK